MLGDSDGETDREMLGLKEAEGDQDGEKLDDKLGLTLGDGDGLSEGE